MFFRVYYNTDSKALREEAAQEANEQEGEIEKPTHPLHVCHDLHNHTGKRPHVALVSWSYFLLTGVLVFGLTQAQRTESAKLAAKMPLLTTCPREGRRGEVATSAVGAVGKRAFRRASVFFLHFSIDRGEKHFSKHCLAQDTLSRWHTFQAFSTESISGDPILLGKPCRRQASCFLGE